jgi:hypothetical protein
MEGELMLFLHHPSSPIVLLTYVRNPIMKKSISIASTLVVSGLLALSAVVSAEEGAAAGAAESESAALSGGAASVGQVTPGFYWCHVQQSYRAIGDNKTSALIERCDGSTSPNGWWWCNDNECEKTFISAAASGNYIGINFNSSSTFSSVRLYKF